MLQTYQIQKSQIYQQQKSNNSNPRIQQTATNSSKQSKPTVNPTTTKLPTSLQQVPNSSIHKNRVYIWSFSKFTQPQGIEASWGLTSPAVYIQYTTERFPFQSLKSSLAAFLPFQLHLRCFDPHLQNTRHIVLVQ